MSLESHHVQPTSSTMRTLALLFVGSTAFAACTMLAGCRRGNGSPAKGESDTDGTAGSSDTSPMTDGPNSGTDTDTDGDRPEPEPEQAPSSKARVKFKGPQRYASDLGQSLNLDRDELCQELSSHDCFATHNIALGGVAPYNAAVYEPLSRFGVSSPIAVDRIALAACGERARLDFAAAGAAIVFIEASSTDDHDALVSDARRLYQRVLRREAEDREVDALVSLYDEVPQGPNRAQTWAQLSCFAVATTMESLFY